jgi:hypothetical protein
MIRPRSRNSLYRPVMCGGATLISSAERGTIEPCVITARILWSTWENARGPGAGAVIAVLRGLCAEVVIAG